MQLRISPAQCPDTSPFFFFRKTRFLPQSSVRARAGHRPCNVKPGQVHEAKLSKRLAARGSSKRLRQQKIPPWANPSARIRELHTLVYLLLLSRIRPNGSQVARCSFFKRVQVPTNWVADPALEQKLYLSGLS